MDLDYDLVFLTVDFFIFIYLIISWIILWMCRRCLNVCVSVCVCVWKSKKIDFMKIVKMRFFFLSNFDFVYDRWSDVVTVEYKKNFGFVCCFILKTHTYYRKWKGLFHITVQWLKTVYQMFSLLNSIYSQSKNFELSYFYYLFFFVFLLLFFSFFNVTQCNIWNMCACVCSSYTHQRKFHVNVLVHWFNLIILSSRWLVILKPENYTNKQKTTHVYPNIYRKRRANRNNFENFHFHLTWFNTYTFLFAFLLLLSLFCLLLFIHFLLTWWMWWCSIYKCQ